MYADPYELSLIQINLKEYKEGPISEQGLENIHALFLALNAQQKQYIVRFLYDWDGKTEETEPDDMQIILRHMEQLKPVLEAYEPIIFALQGIFVGQCGEMHGSLYTESQSMKILLEKLDEVTPKGIYLSVRTPQQWRILTGISEETAFGTTALSGRLGLYNDGMMGTWQDTGTYGEQSKAEAGPMGKWTREEELAFQEELCKQVPNGGEVIIENPVNDFENAVESFATMHVTYLNRAYDQNVLNKWSQSVGTQEG